MKTQSQKMADGGWNARSVLECGGSPPFFPSSALMHPDESARGLAQSKACRLRPILFCFLLSALCFQAWGQSYSLNWSTIDGGGGTSTNGQYSVTGGFWALPSAVQTPGAPLLMIVPAGAGQATISWTPATGINWVLQENLNLATTNWVNSVSGATNPVTVPATVPKKFFRLHKP